MHAASPHNSYGRSEHRPSPRRHADASQGNAMAKKSLEIGVSAGLVLAMIILLLIVQLIAPVGLKSVGYILVIVLFIMTMGLAGFKLMDM